MLHCGAASALAFAGLALIKVWYWLELQNDAVAREVKRLEVQVVSLRRSFVVRDLLERYRQSPHSHALERRA